jgi:hypothetical protein
MLKDSAEEVTMAEASLTWTKERIDLLTKLWPERQPDRGGTVSWRELECGNQ